MKQRTITAIFFAAAVLTGIYIGPEGYFLLFFLVSAGMLWELGALLFEPQERGYNFRRGAALLSGVLPFLLYGGAVLFQWPTSRCIPTRC